MNALRQLQKSLAETAFLSHSSPVLASGIINFWGLEGGKSRSSPIWVEFTKGSVNGQTKFPSYPWARPWRWHGHGELLPVSWFRMDAVGNGLGEPQGSKQGCLLVSGQVFLGASPLTPREMFAWFCLPATSRGWRDKSPSGCWSPSNNCTGGPDGCSSFHF